MNVSPSSTMNGRRILLGVSGGIAAYKIPELVRLFKKAGAHVKVVMTPDASRFVTPLTLGTLSENEVLTEIFPENESGSWTKHVSLGLWADLFIVAPATAQTITKLAAGSCDSMLTAVGLTARCPILVCPAMDHDMYIHPATERNMDTLRQNGAIVMDAEHGSLASGLIGQGRLPEPTSIFEKATELIKAALASKSGPLAGKKVLVTAGPTREAIDPVRFITNHSTGTMGYEIARSAGRRGADVVLVSGPTSLATPDLVRRIDVVSTHDMHEAVQQHADADIVIMVAAVADFTPTKTSTSKIKKTGTSREMELEPTVDILAGLGASRLEGQVLIGFALETDNGLENAKGKLDRKNLDWIVLNNPKEDGAGFGTGTNRVTLLSRRGRTIELPTMPKDEVAEAILETALEPNE
jgi:phosphopantothenoylcysteine decarboxylase/phosphopantothenate--cysteine ligase